MRALLQYWEPVPSSNALGCGIGAAVPSPHPQTLDGVAPPAILSDACRTQVFLKFLEALAGQGQFKCFLRTTDVPQVQYFFLDAGGNLAKTGLKNFQRSPDFSFDFTSGFTLG